MGQTTALPYAFIIGTLHDPTIGAWNMDTDGRLSCYKACLVANGSTQLEGVDVDETFSPVVKLGTIWTVVSLAASRHWRIHQLDVKNAFLYASFKVLLQHIIRSLHQEFAMTDLGSLNYFLGISVTRESSRLFLSQKKYDVEILERANMANCNPSRTPIDTESKLGSDGDPVFDPTLYRSLAGSLQYLTFTRPDISYAVQHVCLYMHDPREPYFSALKRFLRYVHGTLNYGFQLFSSSTMDLVAYSDADWAGCPTTRHSTSGYWVYLGNNLLYWSSNRQPTLSCSSTEAEYRGVANDVAETCWLCNLLCELHTPLSSATLVYCDNVSAVYLSCNPVQHQRTKHIEIDINFVRDLVVAGQVRVLHVPSCYQYADIFTKGLPSALFEEFCTSLSVQCPPAPTAGGVGPKWAPCLARVHDNRVLADVGSLPRMFLGPRKAQRPGKPIIRHQVPPSLVFLLRVTLFRTVGELSVIAAAKVSHFKILCCVHDYEPTMGWFRCFYVNSKNKGWMSFRRRPGSDAACYSKPLDSLEGWNNHFFWVDAFACSTIFPWHTSKSVSKDPFPKSTKFNTGHYASLVAYPAPFHKYPEPFICLVGLSRYYTLDENTYPEFLYENGEEMNLLSFIRTVDPSKVRIGKRKHGEDKPQLLDTTVGRVVPLLPVAPARTDNELEASVDRLFDEGSIGTQLDQRDPAGGIDVIPLPPRRHKKRKTIVMDAGEPSHPPKRLKEDHRTLSRASIGGKSMSMVWQLLVGVMQNAEVRGEHVPTLPFVTSSVSATPEHEGEDHTDFAEVDSVVRSSALVVITITTVTTMVDAATTVKEAPTRPFLFGAGSYSAARIDPTPGSFSDVYGSDFPIGDIRTVVDPDFDLQKAYVPYWSVTNGSHLDEGRVCHEM
ncbi:ribonuclease H-like domain-containing protein [Tanacetum coccineum]